MTVSFDVESWFTKVLVKEVMQMAVEVFPLDTVELFHHCLTSMYFSWNHQYYEQIDDVPMGRLLTLRSQTFIRRGSRLQLCVRQMQTN